MIRCMVVDDEAPALRQVVDYVSRVPFLELAGAHSSALGAMKDLLEKETELLFLDVNMPDLSGIDLIRSLAVKPLVIFTTAYSQYALDGFRVDAVDFLLKPFSFHEFLKAADKARKLFELRSAEHLRFSLAQPYYGDSLFLEVEDKVMRIEISDILYVEAVGEYICIHDCGGRNPVVTTLNIEQMESRLPAKYFMRVHQQYVVNLKKIAEVFRLRVILEDNTYIPVSEEYKERFMQYITGRKEGKG